MLIQLDPTSTVPLFAQIAGAVRRQIADGTLAAGDRLPAGRQLAAALDVNMHTVLRAYQLLRDEGLVDMRRSRGVVVTAQAPDDAGVIERVQAFIELARTQGLTDPEIISLLEAHL